MQHIIPNVELFYNKCCVWNRYLF